MRSVLIATGGTIARDDSADRMLDGAELASRFDVAFDDVVDVASKPSWDLDVDDMEAIANTVRLAVDDGADVVVVTHGTDTVEETAWLCELMLGSARRRTAAVVFTGAMRFADHAQTDGGDNLRAARSHADGASGNGHGVQVVFSGRVHAARWVRKVSAVDLDAFSSSSRPAIAPPPPDSSGVLERRVAQLKVGPVARPTIPEGLAGLVIEGTGLTHVPSEYQAPIGELTKRGVPVVIATRCDAVTLPDYDSAVLRAGDLTAEKAAIALMTALGTSSERDFIRVWWDELLKG